MNYTSYYSLEKTTVRLVLFSRKTKCRITSHEVAIKNVVQQNKKFTRMIQISLTQAPKRCWHLPFRDNLTSNFTYVPYAAKQGAFISADQSIMHDSCKIGTSKTARLTNDYSVEGQLIVHQVKWWKQSRVLYPYESSYFIFVLRWLLMQHHLERKKISTTGTLTERESYVFQSYMLARKVRTLKRKIEFRSFSKKQHEKQQRQHLVKKRMYQPDYLLET